MANLRYHVYLFTGKIDPTTMAPGQWRSVAMYPVGRSSALHGCLPRSCLDLHFPIGFGGQSPTCSHKLDDEIQAFRATMCSYGQAAFEPPFSMERSCYNSLVSSIFLWFPVASRCFTLQAPHHWRIVS